MGKGVLYRTSIMCTSFKSLIPIRRFLYESTHHVVHVKKYNAKDAKIKGPHDVYFLSQSPFRVSLESNLMAREFEICHFDVAKCPHINSELLILHLRGAILTSFAAYLFLNVISIIYVSLS